MKLNAETICGGALAGAILFVLMYVLPAVPAPPESGDLLFKVGWYLGGVVSHVENLFR